MSENKHVNPAEATKPANAQAAPAPGLHVTKKGDFLRDNIRSIALIAGIILLLALGYFLYQKVYLKNRSEDAAAKMFRAEQKVGIDSLDNRAINGEGGYPGFKQIADEYANTKSANLANLYMGGIYLRQGKYQQALDALGNYSNTGSIVADPLAAGMMGDAYSELKQYDKAATYYQKAIDFNSKFTSPMFLKKLGLVKEATGNFKDAETAYLKIKASYPASPEAQLADAYAARARGKQN